MRATLEGSGDMLPPEYFIIKLRSQNHVRGINTYSNGMVNDENNPVIKTVHFHTAKQFTALVVIRKCEFN